MTRAQLTTALAVIAGIAVVAIFFFVANPFAASTGAAPSEPPAQSSAGLVVQDETLGTGATAQMGDTVAVSYIGKLQDGTVFDQSSAHTDVMPGCQSAGEYCFTLGAGQVIPGWDQGIQGMKVGGKRLLIIPPSLGYGAQAEGPIPPNSTLVFEIDLLGVTAPTSTPSAQ